MLRWEGLVVVTSLTADRDLTVHDVQQLAGADAVAAFFASLGYNTDTRLPQSPPAMGITAESLQRKIRRIERIADQEEGTLQVYLVELDSVTVEATRGLARSLRDRVGNYLLVLTSDYEQLDLVLVERQLPITSAAGLSAPRVGVRPRVLTVARRNPDQVALRVMRRFSYTEADADAQYDKLLSAYTVADWSEPLFNNRALFADYYLKERLPGKSEWAEDPKPAYLHFLDLYRSAGAPAGTDEAGVRRQLIEPALSALGFTPVPGKRAPDAPDYVLGLDSAAGGSVACLAYPWDRNLDGKDEKRDTRRPAENPGARVVSVLESGVAPWAIVTNGKLWRLYSAAAHSRATNYYEIDLQETLAMPDPGEPFRYFWLLFRAPAFQPRDVVIEGESRKLSFVEELLHESGAYAKRLGDRLKDRVFEEVFPELAAGFIAHLRHLEGTTEEISQERLDQLFHGTLTLLYRVLFILYAEARGLLPARETRGYWNKSLGRLKAEIAEAAGPIWEEARKRLAASFSADPGSTGQYDRLLDLARIVDRGDASMNTPSYDGGLFLSDVDPEDRSPEAEAARFLLRHKVPDRFLAIALDRLARDEDEKRGDLVPIDYKSLGVRQLGSIYEGLLEFRLRIASEKMATVKGKKTDEIVPYREAVKEKRTILTGGRGRNAPERTLSQGALYLENDRRERKATGSYYTPDHIVKYIVEHAVGPVLREHLERLRPRLREAQQAYHAARQRQAGFEKLGMAGDNPEKVANDPRWQAVADELFEFRVLDPAMGSGHFLVEAVDFITDKTLDFLNGFPWNPVLARIQQTRESILVEMDRQGVNIDISKLTDVNLLKRHVLKRCIYGVDLNPMAVELAKVSVWLDCFTLGAPLSFLDHHLKCGNSLIGATVQAVEAELEAQKKGHHGDLFGGPFQGLLTATATMEELARTPDATMEQTRRSHSLFAEFEGFQSPYKAALDIWVSRHFGNPRAQELLTLAGGDLVEWISDGGRGLSPQYQQAIVRAAELKAQKRFFHWDLEFPEAFVDLRQKAWKPQKQQGFDAVIGNPPYDVLASEELGYDVSDDLGYFEAEAVYEPAIRGKKNLYKLFMCRGISVLCAGGAFSFIVPMALLGDDQSAEVRRLMLDKTGLVTVEAFPQKDDPRKRVFPEAKLSTTVFVTRARPQQAKFVIRAHPDRYFEDTSPTLCVSPEEIIRFDPLNAPIPSCTQRDWEIAVRIIRLEHMRRIGDYCRASQGEVNETADGKKGFISKHPADGPQILRGSTISLYAVREASQGEAIYLRKGAFLAGKPNSAKAQHHEQPRVGWQESSPQNNFRRIIAAPVPKDEFCNHLINYIPAQDSQLQLDLVIALLNSRILEWYFRLASTNAHVSHYQVHNLPVPTIGIANETVGWRTLAETDQWPQVVSLLHSLCHERGVIPQSVAEALADLSRRIQDIESARLLHSRSERSALSAESQPIQDAIDAVLFRCYGLTEEEGQYIGQRLKEML